MRMGEIREWEGEANGDREEDMESALDCQL